MLQSCYWAEKETSPYGSWDTIWKHHHIEAETPYGKITIWKLSHHVERSPYRSWDTIWKDHHMESEQQYFTFMLNCANRESWELLSLMQEIRMLLSWPPMLLMKFQVFWVSACMYQFYLKLILIGLQFILYFVSPSFHKHNIYHFSLS